MIQIVDGKGVGAGKSYLVIEFLMAHWSNGGTAYISNSFVVVWDECKRYAEKKYGLLLQDEQYKEVASENIHSLHEHTSPGTEECPVLIVVDEAQDQLDVRDHQNKSKKDLFSWCCQSRHDDNDLLFVSQSAKNVDARIRRLATFTWNIRNAKNFTIQGLGNLANLIKLATLGFNDGFYFIRNQLDYDGVTSIDVKWVKADKGLFKCYKSKSMAQSRKRLGAPIAKLALQRKKGTKPMYRWIVLGALAVLISGIVTMCNRGGIFKSLDGGGKPVAATAPAKTGPVASLIGGTQSQAVGAYDIRHEAWLASYAGGMKTVSGTYDINRMSVDGFVVAIKDKVAKITTPTGRTLYIIGEDYKIPPGAVAAPMPSASPKPIIIAPYTPREGITGENKH